jgi:hypothetical protein
MLNKAKQSARVLSIIPPSPLNKCQADLLGQRWYGVITVYHPY